MDMFYTITLAMIMGILGAVLLLLLKRPKSAKEWLLIAFVSSLALNMVWGFVEPIAYGLEKHSLLNIGYLLNRIISVLGYLALFLHVVMSGRDRVA